MLSLNFFCQMIIAKSHFRFGKWRDKEFSEKSERKKNPSIA